MTFVGIGKGTEGRPKSCGCIATRYSVLDVETWRCDVLESCQHAKIMWNIYAVGSLDTCDHEIFFTKMQRTKHEDLKIIIFLACYIAVSAFVIGEDHVLWLSHRHGD
jgi:hypothetical protein